MDLWMDGTRLKKSVLIGLCIVVGDFLFLAFVNHHLQSPPRWLLEIPHFIFWPLFFTMPAFPSSEGPDNPTHLALASAGVLDLIAFTVLVYLLWSLLARRQPTR